MQITAAYLRSIAPGASALITDAIVENAEALADFSDVEIAYFLGQCACETFGFTRLEENLFYVTANRLCAVWPSEFPNEAAAAPYLKNPVKLANFVYNGRLGNRPGTSDGWGYRGSGLLNTTGRNNFAALGSRYGDNPDLVRYFPEALNSAVAFWQMNGLTHYADTANIVGLTKHVQGGTGGLDTRKLFTDRALGSLKAPPSNATYLRRGSSGDTVKTIQSLLKAKGFNPGIIDGRFGAGTQRAVADFQTSAHILPVDGIVGPNTLARLSS